MVLDIKTLMLLNLVINFVNAFVLAIIWRQYRKHYSGLAFLLLNMVLQMTGFILSLLREGLPGILSIVLSNTLLVVGALLLLIGLEQFFDFKSTNLHNYIFVGLFVATLSYFYFIDPDMRAREISVSLAAIFVASQICWLLFSRISKEYRRIAGFTAGAFFLYIIPSILRIVMLFAMPSHTDFFQSGLLNGISIAFNLTINALITMSLTLMVCQRLESEIQSEKEKYNYTFKSAPYAIFLARLSDGKIFEVNEGFEKIMGYRSNEAIGRTTVELNLWCNLNDRASVITELKKGNEILQREMQFRNKSGGAITGLVSAKSFIAYNEKCILTSVSDITEMTQIRQELQELATHDVLTGLPNRKLFYDRFLIAKANAQRETAKLAVISLDIDLLKTVNDTYGHAVGDQVLIETSKSLAQVLRKSDTVARFGGDEFALLIWRVKQKEDVLKVVAKIQALIAKPIKVGDNAIHNSMSFGVAVFPSDGTEIDDLLKKSDQAMYYIKEHGRNNHQFYDELSQG